MYTILTTIIDNIIIDKDTHKLVIHGNGGAFSRGQKVPERLKALVADPDASPAAAVLRRIHKEILESKGVDAHKRLGYSGLFDVISNLNSAWDLR